jgi:hypothetical protein
LWGIAMIAAVLSFPRLFLRIFKHYFR